jgi:opacity protein-like surface antigen
VITRSILTKEKMMKTFMFTTALVALMSTAAVAEDFKATEFVTTARSGALEFSIGTVDGDVSTFTTGATVAAYTLGRFETNVYTSLTYGRLTDTLDLTVEYNAQTALNDRWTAYGTAALSYVTSTGDLGAGDIFAAPTLGVSYAASDRVNIFGDVTYAWNASNNWSRNGGALEIGVDYALNDRVSITPSLIRTFDTGSDATNFKLEVGFSF